jgi:ribonucleoside-diphosphate reductase alpha chain
MCKSNIDGINRLVSLSLRAGVKVEEIIDQLKGISCPACTRVKTKGEQIDGISCPDVIARVLEEEYKSTYNFNPVEKENKKVETTQTNEDNSVCPECGEKTLTKYDGCVNCTNCTYTRCR